MPVTKRAVQGFRTHTTKVCDMLQQMAVSLDPLCQIKMMLHWKVWHLI